LNAEPPLSQVELLQKHHHLEEFECKKHQSLNDWLNRFALTSQQSESSRTYVVHWDNRVIGYYSLCAGAVSKAEATGRVAKGQPNYPISVILLARLAIDHTEQGRKLGAALLKDALLRCSQAADIIGVRAVLVHAIDDDARNFYKHFGFGECPLDDLHLMLLMKDLRNSLSV